MSSEKSAELHEEQVLQKLKDIFLLLDPTEASSSDQEHNSRLEKVTEMFEWFTLCSRRLTDYYHMHFGSLARCNYNNIVPWFMHLLRESVLTHQWPETFKLVQSLTKEMRGTETTIWKMGLACLYQDGERNSRLVEQFVKQLYIMQRLAVVEVMLDYLLFLLTQSSIDEVKQLVQDLKVNTLFPSQLINEKRKMAHTLFFAYQGLALYAEWKAAIFKLDQEDGEGDFITHLLSQGSTSQTAKGIADNAVEYLITIKNKPGVWDIFISRLVEIYQYYGNIEEARVTLNSYVERNPTNPNAHRYLYELESSIDGEEAVQIQCLKSILQLDPCNPLCLKLFSLIEPNDPGSVCLLFDYLDFNHCNEDEPVWTALAIKLNEMEDSTELKEVIKMCWQTRKDWWPLTMFDHIDYDKEHKSSSLCSVKRQVQQSLLSLDQQMRKRQRKLSGSSSGSAQKAKRWKT